MYMFECMCVCLYVYIYDYLYTCIHVCIYIYIYIYVFIYIHSYISSTLVRVLTRRSCSCRGVSWAFLHLVVSACQSVVHVCTYECMSQVWSLHTLFCCLHVLSDCCVFVLLQMSSHFCPEKLLTTVFFQASLYPQFSLSNCVLF